MPRLRANKRTGTDAVTKNSWITSTRSGSYGRSKSKREEYSMKSATCQDWGIKDETVGTPADIKPLITGLPKMVRIFRRSATTGTPERVAQASHAN
jgi:hypothetical protein